MFRLVVVSLAAVCVGLSPMWGEVRAASNGDGPSAAARATASVNSTDDTRLQEDMAIKVEQAVIHPYQSSNVGAEVSGVLQSILFEEGDHVEKEAVVAEVKADRIAASARKALERLGSLKLELEHAELDLEMKRKLLELGGGVRQELEKAQILVEISRRRIKEAEEDLAMAELDLKACEIRAPFSGYVAVRYKQPHEAVERFEKVFAIVDSGRVFAVGNIPEPFLLRFRKGSRAVFVHSSGKKFGGTVERLSKLIDPKSMTKRVYVLIDNREGELEVGMTGTLESAE